jgi:molecular chaperone HscB
VSIAGPLHDANVSSGGGHPAAFAGVGALSLTDDDFGLFGLAPRFAQDRLAIDERWKQLQREAHPDRVSSQGAAAQRIAMQWSVRINEAYRRLKDPLPRAAYLCELRGAPIEAENNTAMPADFLMQQMEWREALDDAGDEAALDNLQAQLDAARQERLREIELALDERDDAAAAAQHVRALMFIERFAHDVEARFDQLGQ